MTIREVYEAIGANYQDAMERLPGEAFVTRFALKFLKDDSFPNLKTALAEGNAEDAFRAAHTLKGVCQNLGFENLYVPAAALTEALRDRTFDGTEELVPPVEVEYQKTVEALKKFEAAQNA